MNNEIRGLRNVKAVGSANAYPGAPSINLNLFTVSTDNGYVDRGIECYSVDENYFNALGIQMVKGRNFSREFGSDSSAVIINETTAQFFGFDDPIGKKMYASSDQNKPASFTQAESCTTVHGIGKK